MDRLVKDISDSRLEEQLRAIPRIKKIIEMLCQEKNIRDMDQVINPLLSWKHIVEQMLDDGEYIPFVATQPAKRKKKKPTNNQQRLDDLFGDDVDEDPDYNPNLYKHVNIANAENRIEGLK